MVGTVQRTREIYPAAKPRIISDNGPQFIANDFKAFIRFNGMTHVRKALLGSNPSAVAMAMTGASASSS